MFNRTTETKLAVLEERLTAYEVMMKKIDEAIQIMGTTSHCISKMLAVHEEKLETTIKNDDLIVDRIKTIEVKNTEEHNRVLERFESLERKVEDKVSEEHATMSGRINVVEKDIKEVSKIKWMTIGMGVVVAILAAAFSSLASGWWTPTEMQMQQQGHTHSVQENAK